MFILFLIILIYTFSPAYKIQNFVKWNFVKKLQNIKMDIMNDNYNIQRVCLALQLHKHFSKSNSRCLIATQIEPTAVETVVIL